MPTKDVPATPGTADRPAPQLTEAVGKVVAAAGYDLEELVVRATGQRSVVRVVVDRDEGVSLDDVAELSRAVSEALEADGDGMGRSPYVLEVTSPGVDRPLTLPRHWRRNVGRLVSVEVGPDREREQLSARVLRVTGGGIVVSVERGGAKKGQARRSVGERSVAWAELGEGRVQVEFSRPPGHRDAALDATGGADGEPGEHGRADEAEPDETEPEPDENEIDDLNDEHGPSGSGGVQ